MNKQKDINMNKKEKEEKIVMNTEFSKVNNEQLAMITGGVGFYSRAGKRLCEKIVKEYKETQERLRKEKEEEERRRKEQIAMCEVELDDGLMPAILFK